MRKPNRSIIIHVNKKKSQNIGDRISSQNNMRSTTSKERLQYILRLTTNKVERISLLNIRIRLKIIIKLTKIIHIFPTFCNFLSLPINIFLQSVQFSSRT